MKYGGPPSRPKAQILNPYYEFQAAKNVRKFELQEASFSTKALLIQNAVSAKTAEELKSKSGDTEAYTLQKYRDLPIIYVSFSGPATQGLAFDRLNFFIEFHPLLGVLSDSDLRAQAIADRYAGSDGSDFRLTDIARFFSKAEENSVALNIVELKLRDELIASKLLRLKDGIYEAVGEAAIIGATNTSSMATISHELNHAIYFADPAYARAVKEFWRKLDENDRQFGKQMLEKLFPRYNFKGDEDLLIREFIAYFRDPDELIHSYLEPSGEGINEETRRKLTTLSEKIKALDSQSLGYQKPEPLSVNSKNDVQYILNQIPAKGNCHIAP